MILCLSVVRTLSPGTLLRQSISVAQISADTLCYFSAIFFLFICFSNPQRHFCVAVQPSPRPPSPDTDREKNFDDVVGGGYFYVFELTTFYCRQYLQMITSTSLQSVFVASQPAIQVGLISRRQVIGGIILVLLSQHALACLLASTALSLRRFNLINELLHLQ